MVVSLFAGGGFGTNPRALTAADRTALVTTAFRRLPAELRLVPYTAPKDCDRLDRASAEGLLGGPIVATRGSTKDGAISCHLMASPGSISVAYHSQPQLLPAPSLPRVPGIAAEVRLNEVQDAHVVVDGKQTAHITFWLPSADMQGSKGGFVPVTPPLAAFCQSVADATPR